MPFDRDHLQAPFRKLNKATKNKSSKFEDPEKVHKLRTNTRRVEAILGAVELLRGREAKTLKRSLKRTRRAAGDVRDMDVLTVKAAKTEVAEEQTCQVRLLHHLGRERERSGRKLMRILKRDGGGIRKRLKKAEDAAAHLLRPNEGKKEQSTAASAALDLNGRLRRFATINRKNLHTFRKEAKTLRYVLQMAHPRDERLTEGLREMQDAIGEWHDWEELVGIAKEVLDHKGCGLMRELQLQADSTYDDAVRVATRIRREFLGVKRGPAPLRIVRAAEQIAA